MGKDITRVLVETTLRKTLKDIHQSPDRTIRNLVDLALNFSSGDFQKEILSDIQEMLQNEDSAYYTLASNLISQVDTDNIIAFGLNVGYNSCSAGAKEIRKIEQKEGFNIPWSLSLQISPNADRTAQYQSLITQGKALGIYTYLLFTEENPETLLPLIEAHPDCAFFLFISGKWITSSFLKRTSGLQHLMYAIQYDEHASTACRLLRTKKLLFSVYLRYTEQQAKTLINGEILRQILLLKPAFAFFIPQKSCTEKTEQLVYQYICHIRQEQKVPILLMDIKYDNMFIDSIISEDACTAFFDEDGFLHPTFMQKTVQPFNCFQSDLRTIFSAAFPKTTAKHR
ncbi:hypothetical protein [Scatolibacter rhodanostii]|uniref:hypothetical protein n=1 Tax=Scatolibacter rhodanostii TaxID=2014781 RepID=UPI000C07636A|nr:hypothetical protein [Scatolibacter rhodanostii]